MASPIDVLLTQLEECCISLEKDFTFHCTSLASVLDQLGSTTKIQAERDNIGKKNGISKLRKLLALHVKAYEQVVQQHRLPPCDKEVDKLLALMSTISTILRICRNLCANVPSNQYYLRKEGLVDIVLDFSSRVVSDKCQIFESESDRNSDVKKQLLFFFRTAVQFLSNFITSNHENQHYLWQKCFPHYFLTLIKIPDTPLVAHIAMLIYNCIHNHEGRKRDLLGLKEGAVILRHFIRCAQEEGGAEQQTTNVDPFEWVYLIVKSTFLDYFPQLYNLLGDSPNAATIEQCVVLRWLCEWISDDAEESKLFSFLKSSENLMFILQQLKQLEALTLFDTSHIAIIFSASSPSPVLQQYLINTEVLQMWLYIVGNLSTHVDNHGKSFWAQHGLLRLVLKLLQDVDKFDEEVRLFMKFNEKELEASEQHKSKFGIIDMTFGLKKEIITIIGNLCYKHKGIQDEIRELGGIPIILNHTSVDENNPFIREWSILAIRNLCENNSENQGLIASLQPKGVVENELLNKLGLKAELLPSGKLKITPQKLSTNSDNTNTDNNKANFQ